MITAKLFLCFIYEENLCINPTLTGDTVFHFNSTLSSILIVLYLKVSTLEAQEPTLLAAPINQTLLMNLKLLQIEFKEFLQ